MTRLKCALERTARWAHTDRWANSASRRRGRCDALAGRSGIGRLVDVLQYSVTRRPS